MLLSNRNQKFASSQAAFGAKQPLTKQAVESMKHFKDGGAYKINRKLRGLDKRSLTAAEKKIIADMESLPKRVLRKDTFVYRGIGTSFDFDPVSSLKVGKPFLEKGFSSVSTIKDVAELFQYGCGVLAKILLPKGSEVVDIDALLTKNGRKLPEDFLERTRLKGHPRHEWVLMPNAEYKVMHFAENDTPCKIVQNKNGDKTFVFDASRGDFTLKYNPKAKS